MRPGTISLVAVLVLLASCSGGDDGGGEPLTPVAATTARSSRSITSSPVRPAEEGETPAASTPNPTALTTATPAPPPPTSTSLPTDDDRVAAALAAYADDPLPRGTVAYDVLDRRVLDGGDVQLVVCTWDGMTPFDATYRIVASDMGSTDPAPTLTVEPAGEPCLNTELVRSALGAVEEFLAAFHRVQTDPVSITETNRDLRRLTTPDLFMAYVDLVNEWLGSQISWRTTQYRPGLAESRVGELLYRRYSTTDRDELALAVCRPMVATHGRYRNDELVDDERPDDPGDYAAIEFRMARTEAGDGWQMITTDSLVWAHCFRGGDWPGAVNDWKPDPVPWDVVRE
jgi:hypothetical protein